MIQSDSSDILLWRWNERRARRLHTTLNARAPIPEEHVPVMTVTLLNLAQATAHDAMSRGVAIAAVGLIIVFSALILISLFIAALPRVLGVVARIWPETDDVHSTQSHPESQVPDDGAVLAAIGFVLHTEIQKQLALEKTSAKKN